VTVYDKLTCYHGPKQGKFNGTWIRQKGGSAMKRRNFAMGVIILLTLQWGIWASAEDLGRLSSNLFDPESTSNPFGAGSPYRSDSINNPYGPYGSPYSPKSATNPYSTDAPKLYDSQGNYRGRLSSNPYDSDSTSNPYGKYGSPYSSESINNPYGAGNPYSADSPNNPYGKGWHIEGSD